MSGVRGRVVLTVVVVTACLYSALGTVGFLHIANGGRDAIRHRIEVVLDQLELGLRNGSGTVRITTADGVEADAFPVDAAVATPSADVVSARVITIGAAKYRLVGHASRAPLDNSLRSVFRALWIGVPLGVLLTAAIAGLAIRRALRPVSDITALAATIGAGDASSRVPVPDTDDEIEQLAITVNAMLDRIAAGRTAQRRFTSDAAHELRTPLMALQGEIELAAGADALPTAGLLGRLGQLSDRLAQRVDDLVTLSTLDEHPPLELRTVDLLALVRAEVEDLVRLRPLPVVVCSGGEVAVHADARMLTRAVRNLVVNAQRHAVDRVEVSVGVAGDRAYVQVDDDGSGIAEEDRETAVARFGRLDEARSADTGGAGLGLAIVASVAQAHDGSLTIGTAALGGARVRLELGGLSR